VLYVATKRNNFDNGLYLIRIGKVEQLRGDSSGKRHDELVILQPGINLTAVRSKYEDLMALYPSNDNDLAQRMINTQKDSENAILKERHLRELLEKDALMKDERHMRELLEKDVLIIEHQHDNELIQKDVEILTLRLRMAQLESN
jgi:hypothetical protein